MAGINASKLWLFERDTGEPADDRLEPREFKELRAVFFSADGRNVLVAHRSPLAGAVVEVIPLKLTAADRTLIAKGFPQTESAAPIDLQAATAMRIWTDATGKFTVEAEFVELADGQLKLKRASGAEVVLPLEKLSQSDQQLAAAIAASRPPPPQPLPMLPPVKAPEGWITFTSESGDFSVAAPGKLEKQEYAAPSYALHEVGRPYYNVMISDLIDPAATTEEELNRNGRSAVRLNDGKMIEESELKGVGVPARKFVYEIEIDDEVQRYYHCNYFLNGKIVVLTAVDKPGDFRPEDLRDVTTFFESFRPLRLDR